MSNNTTGKEQVIKTYADEIGIVPVSINTAKMIAQLCWEDNHVPLFISESGIGKTAGVKQLARTNNMTTVVYSLAHCESSDVTGPPYPREDGTYTVLRDGRVPLKADLTGKDRVTEVLLEKLLTKKEFASLSLATYGKVQGKLDANGLAERTVQYLLAKEALEAQENRAVVLFFDEINRAPMDTLNAVFPVWTERRLGTFELGPNVRVVAAMNPPGGAYSVTTQFSTDPAMRRRCCQIFIEFSSTELFQYMASPGAKETASKLPPLDLSDVHTRDALRPWHPCVQSYLRSNPGCIQDEASREAGKVYGNPSTWEAVSDTLYTVERLKLDLGDLVISRAVTHKIAGHVGYNAACEVLSFYKDSSAAIDPKALLLDFKEGSQAFSQVHMLLSGGDHGALSNTMLEAARLYYELEESVATTAGVVSSIALLVSTAPLNTSQAFMMEIARHSREQATDRESRILRMYRLVDALAHNSVYNSYQEAVRDAFAKASREENQTPSSES